MTGFFEIFQPGLKHLQEERDRQNMLVSKPTHGGGPPLGIDLDGGTAKITISVSKAQPADDDPAGLDASGEETAAGTGDAETSESDAEDAGDEELEELGSAQEETDPA